MLLAKNILNYLSLIKVLRKLSKTNVKVIFALCLKMKIMKSRICLEKAMAPHSSTLAWKIPWTEDPGRLQSMGSLRVGHD